MHTLLKFCLFCSLLDKNCAGREINLRTMAAANQGRDFGGAFWGQGRGNVFELLYSISEDTWHTKGGAMKRMRHSTGGPVLH